jgi:hypothetical protein
MSNLSKNKKYFLIYFGVILLILVPVFWGKLTSGPTNIVAIGNGLEMEMKYRHNLGYQKKFPFLLNKVVIRNENGDAHQILIKDSLESFAEPNIIFQDDRLCRVADGRGSESFTIEIRSEANALNFEIYTMARTEAIVSKRFR